MDEYLRFLFLVNREPRTFKSNFARENAVLVAEAASRGHLTALDGCGVCAGHWQVTSRGVRLLKKFGRIQ